MTDRTTMKDCCWLVANRTTAGKRDASTDTTARNPQTGSGVAVLSCTDCSGSSTASSDITDPGSPFSTVSNHSEDSGGAQPPKMPPAQSAHHPPWPWTAEEGSPPKRPLNDKTVYVKRLKTAEEAPRKGSSSSSSTICLNTTNAMASNLVVQNNDNTNSTNNNNYKVNKKVELTPKMQQGKITEYFKTQVKSNGIRKQLFKLRNSAPPIVMKGIVGNRKDARATNGMKKDAKTRKISMTVPRKILPAPSKLQETLPSSGHVANVHPFTPTMTLTAVSFPSNLAYLHTKGPKPPDNIFLPQFATITNDKVSAIPLINRNPIAGMPIAALNNFNCVKLNATVVPIVNINALPARLNGTSANLTLSVETAMPTVMAARPKSNDTCITNTNSNATLPKQYTVGPVSELVTSSTVSSLQQCRTEVTRTEEPYRTEECQTHQQDQPQEPPDDKSWTEESQTRIDNQKSPSPTDSDSGISSRGSLEISVDEPVTEPPKKSPILSQPKTIRFPPIQRQKQKDEGRDLGKSPPQSGDGQCRWNECSAQFDTSGALLEHLQVEHVISQSQANQEQYVCLWKGCKVHGRTSCSISWLERHVLAHAGTKPFRCIVDGCGQRFTTQLMLERHVNNHFNTDGSQNTSAKKSVENGPVKLFKRNGRIIRFRRQPWSARMFDFIDSGIMEGLQHKLLKMTQARTLGRIESPGETISLQSQILARRTDSKGNKELLVRWHPCDVVPDEWVSEKEYKSIKAMPIPSLSPAAREALRPTLFPHIQKQTGQKQRRKPVKIT
ncbi:AE binding protein 2 jing isoform X3 [Rhynchophorus ferrugineus]|uniref:AE binding protein 2 jing isoform X3 n=1 Tax=Rhynchophorus ferrugineus TaxID=354439 RepID=UPI003FCDB7D6